MTSNVIKIIFFSIFLLPIMCCNYSEKSINIGRWSVLYNEADSIDQIQNEEGWFPIEIPSKFRLPYRHERKFQYLWLKAAFDIERPRNYYGMTFGRIYDTYEIYLNGKKLEFRTPDEIGNVHLPVNFKVSSHDLIKGRNQVYIHLGIYGGGFGGLPDGVRVQPRTDYKKQTKWYDLIYNIVPFSLVFLLMLGMILMLILFLVDRREKFFLWVMLIMFLYVIYIITIFSPYKPVSFGYITNLLAVAGPFLGILFTMTIQSLYRIKLHEYNIIFFPIIILVTVVLIFLEAVRSSFYLNIVGGLVSFLLFIPYVTFIAWKLNSIKPDRFKFLFSLIVINFLLIGGLLDAVFYLTGHYYSFLIATYFSPVLIFGMTAMGYRDYQNRILELRLLYEKISGKKSESRNIITDSTEEKIKEIIDFIHENYKSDISREGLANAVGMNPNYFSCKFKEYTGKKINDYINQLRIDEASEKLKDRELRIIDIALSSGYDCLSTFNRLFKIHTGMSPTEFRKRLKGSPK